MKKANQNLTTIYIVRHGQTEWNKLGLIQGHTDSPLTPEGIRQAHELAEVLKNIHFDEAFSSDLLRARRTAEIIALERQIVIKTRRALRERYFGEYEGKPHATYNRVLTKLLLKYERLTHDQIANLHIGTSETIAQTTTRLITFLREIAVGFRDKTILLVTHGGIMRYFLVRLGFATFKTLTFRSVSNMSYVKLETDGVDFFIKETRGITLFESEELIV